MNIYSNSFLRTFKITFLVVSVIMLAAHWKIFSKAGRPGWDALIPVCATYVLSDVAFGSANYFTASMVVTMLSWIAQFAGISSLVKLTGIASFVLFIFLSIKLSKAFGKSNGFIVGMILLPIIFMPILGFGSAEYIGPDN